MIILYMGDVTERLFILYLVPIISALHLYSLRFTRMDIKSLSSLFRRSQQQQVSFFSTIMTRRHVLFFFHTYTCNFVYTQTEPVLFYISKIYCGYSRGITRNILLNRRVDIKQQAYKIAFPSCESNKNLDKRAKHSNKYVKNKSSMLFLIRFLNPKDGASLCCLKIIFQEDVVSSTKN